MFKNELKFYVISFFILIFQCELNERQRLEADTLYSMQRMVWLKHLPKESANLSSSGRTSYFLNDRYLPRVEINPNFWANWETSPF